MNVDFYSHVCDETKFLHDILKALNDAHDATKCEPIFIKVAQHRIATARAQIQSRLKTLAEI